MIDRMFTLGNTKLGLKILSFSLPPVKTCPGMTKWCSKYCYAQKGYLKSEKIQKRWQENFEITKQADFVDMTVKILNEWFKRGIDCVRIHASGDFYSQEYFDKWKEIAKRLPRMKFVAYTRSYNLDFSNLPRNFKLFYSVDPTTEHYPSIELPKAYVPQEIAPSNAVRCLYPSTTCSACMVCFNVKKSRDVAFKVH